MRSGARGRLGETDARGGMATGQSQSRFQTLGDRAPGGCPRAALVGPSYLHPTPGRAALSHRLEMRDPSPGRAAELRIWAALELRSGAGFRVYSSSPWEGAAAREESLEVCTGILLSLGFQAAQGPAPRRD